MSKEKALVMRFDGLSDEEAEVFITLPIERQREIREEVAEYASRIGASKGSPLVRGYWQATLAVLVGQRLRKGTR